MCFAGLHLLFPCCLDLFLTAGFPFLFTFQLGLEPVRPWRQRGVGRDRKKLVALFQVSELIYPRLESLKTSKYNGMTGGSWGLLPTWPDCALKPPFFHALHSWRLVRSDD